MSLSVGARTNYSEFSYSGERLKQGQFGLFSYWKPTANLSISLSAGIYPAMLAVMVAPTVGINPFDPLWIATLVGIVTISSAGVAGVGGGATFAALIVLPAMGLPVTLVALLISVEPLIDMGRTALNVSGSMTAGTITSQMMRQTDKEIFNQEEEAELNVK